MIKINDRVKLVMTSDPYTKLTPGDKGIVRNVRHDGFSEVYSVEWDSGSRLSMIEGEDHIEVIR